MTHWTRNTILCSLCMAFALLGCEAESTDAETTGASPLAEEEGGGGVDVSSSSPTVTIPADAGPTTEDASVAPLDVATAPEEPEEIPPRFDEDVIVGPGACANESDMEALNSFDPVGDFMEVGMACMDSPSSPGQTDEEEMIACFVEELGTGYGLSDDCSLCVALHAVCTQENCMDLCMSVMMAGEMSNECGECIEESGCKTDFTVCSGLEPDDMQL